MAGPKHVLVTGGAGYIGSHTCVVLMAAGYQVTIVDDLCNSRREVIDRIAAIAGQRPMFIKGDVRDRGLLRRAFSESRYDAVLHFAGLKSVEESVREPLRYFDCNVGGSIALCEAMAEFSVNILVFSSSATVYGDSAALPVTEDAPCAPASPYGMSKLMVENMLQQLAGSDSAWKIACLRYFNPVGAHESGLIGEDPTGAAANLMPYLAKVAAGELERLNIYGNDYPTADGTGVRDYIHVMDLAQGHLAALDRLFKGQGLLTLNLGTGRGYSVLEVMRAFEQASGRSIPHAYVPRRAGDVAASYADASLAERLLGWKATRKLEQMCADTWRWQLTRMDAD